MKLSDLKTWTVFHMMLGITFICSGIILNFIQLILFISVRPFSRNAFRSINFYLVYSSWAQLVFLAEWWAGLDLKVYCDAKHVDCFGNEHAVIVMNHNYDIEWLVGWIVGERCNVLGNCRVYAKKVLKYVPVIGWCWLMSDVLFVARDWSKDSKNLMNCLNELYSYQRSVWVLIFCEGTRFTKEKHETSLKFARERGLPEYKHHLLPRTKGFTYSAKFLKGKFPAIYDVTVGFSSNHSSPTLKNLLFGRKIEASICVRRIPMEEVPTDTDEACNNYLYQLYKEKDDFLDEYLKTGKYPLPLVPLKRRIYSLLNEIMWLCIILVPGFNFLFNIVLYGSYLTCFITGAGLALFYVGVNRLMDVSNRSSSSSNYGKESTSSKKKE